MNGTSSRSVRPRRRRIAGAEVRGNGARALIAATVLQAVSDLRQEGALQAEAREWLLSPGCEYCLEILEIPYRPFLQAVAKRRLRCGTSTRAYWEDGTETLELVA